MVGSPAQSLTSKETLMHIMVDTADVLFAVCIRGRKYVDLKIY